MAEEQPAAEAAASTLPVRRTALLVQYDGTGYQGLQRQAHTQETIQERIEAAVRKLGGEEPRFICAGRTDAGVHATGQVIAVDLPARLEERKIALAMNSLLPADIRVQRARHCGAEFSPRLDATMRSYIYRLATRGAVPPLLRHHVAFHPFLLDEAPAKEAAGAFAGQWELREWRASTCQAKRTFLTISEACAHPPDLGNARLGEDFPYWRFTFRARSFLHHQVRFMVGAIVAVGTGRLALAELKAALAAGTRPAVVKMEEARGLCLAEVEFPPEKDPFLPRGGE